MARKKKLPPGMWQRGNTYYARFSKNGRLVRKRLSTDFAVACEMLNDMRARADRADFGMLDNNYPLADLRQEYLRACEQTLRPSTVRRYRKCLQTVLGAVPVRIVSQLSVQVITAYRRERMAAIPQESRRKKKEGEPLPTIAPRTVNMEVSALSTMLSWGVKHGIIGTNPIKDVKQLPEDVKRKERRALTAEEVLALFDVSPDHLLPVWRMFLTSGIRHDELVNLRFADIDWERQTATVRGSVAKNHNEREIPLDEGVLAMLKELAADAEFRHPVAGNTPKQTAQQAANFSREHVFVNGANTPWRNNLLRTFYAYAQRAGIEGAHRNGSVDIHSLRGSFATLAIDGGASPKAIQAILGHATLDMTMRIYAKATENAKRQAVSALPFASASNPAHVITMDEKRTESRTQAPAATQHEAVQAVG